LEIEIQRYANAVCPGCPRKKKEKPRIVHHSGF